MCKEVYGAIYKKRDGCVNEEPGQQSHDYCLLVDPVTKATECFNGAFSKVDIYLANELCFKKFSKTIPIPVCDIDLYMNREKLLETLNWMNKLRSKFVEVYSATMQII